MKFTITIFTDKSELLTGNRVCIDICSLDYSIIMKNPSKESCFHPSCNNEGRIWTFHTFCPEPLRNRYPSINSPEYSSSPNVRIPNTTFSYTPQILAYFKQLPYVTRLKKRKTIPIFTIKGHLKKEYEEELYL